MDATKHDSINMWLLSNLQASSEEKKRRRAFLANSEELNEEQWARLVLKYWLLDEAATCLEDRSESTNGAVNSAGLCHSQGYTSMIWEKSLEIMLRASNFWVKLNHSD